MKKQTGIWLDLRGAYIIELPVGPHEDDEPDVEVLHLVSHIEESSATGGTRSKTPWGPQHGDPRRAAQERRHHEEKAFFQQIIDAIAVETDELVLFGPSEAKHGLANAIETIKHFHPRIVGVEGADRMTPHELVDWVRDYYKRPAPRKLPRGQQVE